MSEVHKGDIGTVFRVTMRDEDGKIVDIASGDTTKIIFQKPGKSRMEKVATLTNNGDDGKFEYKTVSGDIDEAGQWAIQGLLQRASNDQWFSDIQHFAVLDNL